METMALSDLSAEIQSLDPLHVFLPEDPLRAFLQAELKKALRPLEEHSMRMTIHAVELDLVEGGLRIHAEGRAGIRHCQPLLWPLSGEFCTPWIDDNFRADVDLSLAVENWIVQTHLKQSSMQLANPLFDGVKNLFFWFIHNPVHSTIGDVLNGFDGKGIRREIETFMEMTIDAEAKANIELDKHGMHIHIGN